VVLALGHPEDFASLGNPFLGGRSARQDGHPSAQAARRAGKPDAGYGLTRRYQRWSQGWSQTGGGYRSARSDPQTAFPLQGGLLRGVGRHGWHHRNLHQWGARCRCDRCRLFHDRCAEFAHLS